MTNGAEKPPGTGSRIGRRVGQVAYFGFVGFFALAAVVQITRHVFFPEPDGPVPFATCSDGLSALYQAVERGRQAAEHGANDDDEEAALLRYRSAVLPDWRYRDSIARLCDANPKAIAVLDAIERLRYSEEHGVRHQAVELTALRRKVKDLLTASAR
ncbi:MAG: hypothetical protein FJ095_15370 [Deltaproteobacteria bacterium]|nr:hypothetical protein [Deltaproteobacteria bacterium]